MLELLGSWPTRLGASDLLPHRFEAHHGLTEVDRTIRRRGSKATVAVQLRDRPWGAVVADMIEGIVVANNLTAGDAHRLRAQLWDSVEPPELRVA